ncbi:MAG: GatB/YqeY domain-containing protein [Candidatus Uhrbacteria bacterium]|nr:GatB/YqeY domain-containing protein [Candidatus Uhrbacteria bacterium]
MTLLETIRNDMKDAMRAKDSLTLDTVRMLLASVKNKVIDLGRELEDAEILAVIKSDLKKLKDSLESFASAAREDLAEKARAEIKVLEKYLPAQLADGELEEKVRAGLAELGITSAADMGKAMGQLMGKLKDAADGSRIKAAAERILKGE